MPKVSSILKKATITLSALAILAAGTMVSGYAQTYSLGFLSSFELKAQDTYTTYTNNQYTGTVVDQFGSYPRILNSNYDYSQGYAYIYNRTTDKYFAKNTDFYIQKNYPGHTAVNYGTVTYGALEHRWVNYAGGGFKTTLQAYLYT